jgi:hypothetical protein
MNENITKTNTNVVAVDGDRKPASQPLQLTQPLNNQRLLHTSFFSRQGLKRPSFLTQFVISCAARSNPSRAQYNSFCLGH